MNRAQLAVALAGRLNACNHAGSHEDDAAARAMVVANAELGFAIADYVGEAYGGNDLEVGLADLLGLLLGTTDRVRTIALGPRA